MSIRKNTNPRPLDIQPELQDILVRNGMRAHIRGSSNGFQLVVQGHDSPLLCYPISEKQLKALTDWGTNFANKRAYNTFASIVAADFDMPKDFVHARNANGRVAMGLHGYRIGAGEYGRLGWGHRFLGWTPRQQGGFHLRRIGGNLFFPGAPIVPDRPDRRMKPGELQSGGYGFYYKGRVGIEGNVPQKQDVLKELESVITPIVIKQRNNEPAKPYNELITSPVYFSNEKLQECLRSHGISIDAETKTMTIQSSSTQADFVYDLTDEEVKKLTSNSIKEEPVESRLSLINDIIREDFAEGITMEQLNSDKQITIALHPTVQEDLDRQLSQSQTVEEHVTTEQGLSVHSEDERLSKESASVDGKQLEAINANKGWFREGRHGREVSVGDIRVEPSAEGKYKMTAVINGEHITHEISQKQYDKFMAIDDYHRMKLFSKVFSEVDMKNRDHVGIGTKIGAALLAGVAVVSELGRAPHPPHPAPAIFVERRAYFKPGVDTPEQVAMRNFEAAIHAEERQVHRHNGM